MAKRNHAKADLVYKTIDSSGGFYRGHAKPDARSMMNIPFRLPAEDLYTERPGNLRAGDCVAPRSVLEAVLEGRRRALEICGIRAVGRTPVTTGATP